jgi:hypothetical protein
MLGNHQLRISLAGFAPEANGQPIASFARIARTIAGDRFNGRQSVFDFDSFDFRRVFAAVKNRN